MRRCARKVRSLLVALGFGVRGRALEKCAERVGIVREHGERVLERPARRLAPALRHVLQVCPRHELPVEIPALVVGELGVEERALGALLRDDDDHVDVGVRARIAVCDGAPDEEREGFGVGEVARRGALDQTYVLRGEVAPLESTATAALAAVLVVDLVLGDLFHGHRQVVLRP